MTNSPATPQQPESFRWRLFPAVAIIAIGILFLLGNLGYDLAFLDQGNWWAWLILGAALAPLGRAWELYRAHGRVDGEVAHALLGAVAVATVAVMFLLDLDWGTWWPLFVILGGLFMLVGRPYHRHRHRGDWGSRGEDDPAIRR